MEIDKYQRVCLVRNISWSWLVNLKISVTNYVLSAKSTIFISINISIFIKINWSQFIYILRMKNIYNFQINDFGTTEMNKILQTVAFTFSVYF